MVSLFFILSYTQINAQEFFPNPSDIIKQTELDKDTIQYSFKGEEIKENQTLETKNNTLIEDQTKRTTSSEFYSDPSTNKQYLKSYTAQTYYKDGSAWYSFETATTSKVIFDNLYEISYLEKLKNYLIPVAYSACGDDGGICYSGSGDGSIHSSASWLTWQGIYNLTSGVNSDYTRTDMGDAGYGHAPSTFYQASTGNIQSSHTFIPFDTSALPDNAIIDSAVIYRYIDASVSPTSGTDDFSQLVPSLVVSNSILADSDFNLIASTTDCGSGQEWSSLASGQWEQINLTATGLSYISTSSWTKFAIISGFEFNSRANTPGSNQFNYLDVRSSEYTGTAQDPYILIEFHIASSSSSSSSTPSSAARAPEIPYTNDLTIISGYSEIYQDSTSTPYQIIYYWFHIPFLAWLVLGIPLVWIMSRVVLEIIIRFRQLN